MTSIRLASHKDDSGGEGEINTDETRFCTLRYRSASLLHSVSLNGEDRTAHGQLPDADHGGKGGGARDVRCHF